MNSMSLQLGWLKSRLMYDLVPGRRSRMLRFYAEMLQAGDLCFDVGAHLGSRTDALAAIGCRVVAVEPHPYLAAKLRRRFAGTRDVRVCELAVSDRAGEATLHYSPRYLTVSSLDSGWTESLQRVRPHNIRFSEQVVVATATLANLIDEHGVPRYCKLDIEGTDLAVLRSLSQPIAIVSFEHLPPLLADTIAAVEALSNLADYRFNFFRRESHRFEFDAAVSGAALIDALQRATAARSGSDVFAFRIGDEA